MDKLLKKISGLYNLKDIAYLEPITKGFLSENHVLVNSGDKYFLKKYRFDLEEKIKQIHEVKQFFSSNNIPVILPIINSEDKTYFYFNKGFYALFPFIYDAQLEYHKLRLPESSTISLGKMLANIHLAGRNSTLTITKEFSFIGKLSERAALLIASIEKISEKTPFDMMVLDLLTLKVELSKKYLPIKNSLLKNDHLVHGDYTDQNIFFDKEGNISHVFDFEKTQYQPRTFELFRSMNLIFMNGDNVEQELLDAKLYINSYLQKYPMKKEEFLEGLDMYFRKLINSVWIESEHYLEGNTRVDPLLKQDYVRVKYFGENIEKIKEVLSYNLYI